MKIKTSELIGHALDWAVAKCEEEYGRDNAVTWLRDCLIGFATRYSSVWSQGGPIIEREEIGTYTQYPRVGVLKWYGRRKGSILGIGPTPLIAAMRCYVASKLGMEVDVPEELLK